MGVAVLCVGFPNNPYLGDIFLYPLVAHNDR